MKTSIDTFVIEAVRKERTAEKISQAILSFGIGVAHSFVGQVENPNHRAKYNLNHLNEIAKYLGFAPRFPARETAITHPNEAAAPIF